MMSSHGCAVLSPEQVYVVGDFAHAAHGLSELPGAVVDLHAQTMSAENIYATARLQNFDTATAKIAKDANLYLKSLQTSAHAYTALNVLDRYITLLSLLTSNNFSEQLAQQCAVLGMEIDGSVYQYNEMTGQDIGGFGVLAAESVRAGGGIFIRNRQADAVKQLINKAEPVIKTMSTSVAQLLDLYICGAVDQFGTCVLDDDKQEFPGLAQLAEEGLVTEYQYFLKSGKGQNTVNNLQIFFKLLLTAKSIKPLAEKIKQAMLTFQRAHTRLYQKLQIKQTSIGALDEINIMYGEIQSAQGFKLMIEDQKIGY